MTVPRRGSALLAGALFVLSGALGLGYQLVWIRKATLVVGASQIAVATVVTSFFLGLALGSLAVGAHLRSRRFSPLYVYGLFEAAIGIYALAFPLFFEWVEAAYGVLYPFVANSSEALFLLRFGLLCPDLDNEPRVSMHLDDGRHFVQRAAPASYDVVSMEPPPPTAEGVHALYSLEFYRGVERVLREDGVLMQWVPLYWLTPNEARRVVKTQAAVFPHTFIVRAGSVDFMTLSFKRKDPPRFSTAWIEERAKIFAQERWVKAKRWTEECRHETASLEGILALINVGPEDLARMQAPYIYRDDDQRLSYSSDDRQLLRALPVQASDLLHVRGAAANAVPRASALLRRAHSGGRARRGAGAGAEGRPSPGLARRGRRGRKAIPRRRNAGGARGLGPRGRTVARARSRLRAAALDRRAPAEGRGVAPCARRRVRTSRAT